MGTNLALVIADLKPRAALLTSYTFSLNYFEATLLATLKSVGCSDIAVLVDHSEFRSSLDSSYSKYVGRLYRLLPVRTPGGGIFHPKLAYLVCDNSDVLIVSSGNLSFTGQGGYLECIDAVRADQAPEVFDDFAVFLSDLAAHVVEATPLRDVLNNYEARVRSQRDEYHTRNAHRASWLVQTLSVSASEQLERLVRSTKARATGLTVLSPFHAPDARPLRNFAKKLDIKRVTLGLDPKSGDISLDADAVRTATELSFAMPDLGEDHRISHAKWFEVYLEDRVLVMTGSVNATGQSFSSTKNVEVSLARLLASSPVTWQVARPRQMQYVPFIVAREQTGEGYVEAQLLETGDLTGMVYAAGRAPGAADVALLQADELVCSRSAVTIGAAGTFTCNVGAEWTESDKALQVRVTGNGFSALGWVSNELQLSSSDEERGQMAAVNRVLGNSFGTEDVYEVLALLLQRVEAPGETKNRTASTRTSRGSTDGASAPFSFEAWQHSAHSRRLPGLLARHGNRVIEAAFALLDPVMPHDSTKRPEEGTAHGGVVGGTEGGVLLSDMNDDGADNEQLARERNRELLQNVLQAIPATLRKDPTHPEAATLATLVAAFAINHGLSIFRSDTPEGRAHAARPCLEWLHTFSTMELPESVVTQMAPVIAAIGCLAVVFGTRADASRQIASEVKERFEFFRIPTADESRVLTLCREGAMHRALRSLDEPLRLELEKTLPTVLTVETAADLATRLLAQLRAKPPVLPGPEGADIYGADVYSALRAHMRHPKTPFGEIHGLTEKQGCPCCYHALARETAERLTHRYVAVCNSCGRALILRPPSHGHAVAMPQNNG